MYKMYTFVDAGHFVLAFIGISIVLAIGTLLALSAACWLERWWTKRRG